MLSRTYHAVRRRWRRVLWGFDSGRRRFVQLEPTPDFVRPERNLIITGLARSGTSLVSTAISRQPNAYCANEIFYKPDRLELQLARVRMALVGGHPVPNRYDRDGKLTTDTRRDGATVRYVTAEGKFDLDCLVASKAHTLYLDKLDQLRSVAHRIVALVREPTFTLASWNNPALRYTKENRYIPEYHVTAQDLEPRWSHLRFPTIDRIERQAFLWREYAQLIVDAARRGDLAVVCYEDLAQPGVDWATTFGVSCAVEERFENRNQRDRFGSTDLSRIERAVGQFNLDEVYAELHALAVPSRLDR